MDPKLFQNSYTGRLVPTIEGALAFVPNALPTQLELGHLVGRIEEASRKLGELNGIGVTLPNPYLLVRPLQRLEAIASSNIEGTYASLSDLYMFELGARDADQPPDTQEVWNYVQALQDSIHRLDELPVCLRLLREAHETLLTDVRKYRGASIRPGEIREIQNWIGGSKIEAARFVPPPPNLVLDLLSELEKFIQDDTSELTPLVSVALAHYQFETIHPFIDGNGRVGRLMIPLILTERKILTQPLLYMSPYFERHKDQYIDAMFDVSASGNWTGWIGFFLDGVIQTTEDAISKVTRLLELQEEYQRRILSVSNSSSALQLVNLMFDEPIMSVPRAQEILNMETYRGAQQNILKLVDAEILKEVPGRRRPKIFIATEIYAIIAEGVT